MSLLFQLLRYVSLAVGLALISFALLSERTEEEKVRNRLVGWWVNLSLAGKSVTTRHIAITRAFAKGTLRAIDWVFGKTTISWRLVWSSLMLSIAGLQVSWALVGIFVRRLFVNDNGAISNYLKAMLISSPSFFLDPGLLRCFLWFAAWALVPAIVREPWHERDLYAAMALASGFSPAYDTLSSWRDLFASSAAEHNYLPLAAFFLELSVALIFDIVIISLAREILYRAIRANKYGLAFIGTLLIVPLLLAIPLWQFATFAVNECDASTPVHLQRFSLIATATLQMNTISILLACGLLIFSLLLVANLLTWAALTRLINKVYDRFPTPGQIFSAGLLFVAIYMSPSLTSVAKKFLGLV